jgi:hypothetical protein
MSHVTRNGKEHVAEFLEGDNYESIYLLNGGSEDMAVNGSITPVVFSHTIAADTRFSLNRSLLVMEHGAAAFNAAHFAALGSALANGVEVSITPDGGSKIVLELWKTNRQVRDTMFDLDQTFKTAGVYTGRWTFTKDLNEHGLVLNPGDVFAITIQDNLAAMDFFSFKLKGDKEVIV